MAATYEARERAAVAQGEAAARRKAADAAAQETEAANAAAKASAEAAGRRAAVLAAAASAAEAERLEHERDEARVREVGPVPDIARNTSFNIY